MEPLVTLRKIVSEFLIIAKGQFCAVCHNLSSMIGRKTTSDSDQYLVTETVF